MSAKGTAKFKADEACQRRAGGKYYGITRVVTRASRRVNHDFKPPFGKRACVCERTEIINDLLRLFYRMSNDARVNQNATAWARHALADARKLGVQI